MKAIYLTHFGFDLFASNEPAAPGIEFVRVDQVADLAAVAHGCEILIVSGSRYTAEAAAILNEKMPDIKWIQSTAIGTDKFSKAGIPDGVLFSNAAGLKGRTVSEHGFALMLALFHRIPWVERNRQERIWDRPNIRKLSASVEGKTIVIIGYGSIGQEFARKAKAFDMNVVTVSRKKPNKNDLNIDRHFSFASLHYALKGADVIAPCLPLTDETRNLIGVTELSLMNIGGVVVNIARGGIFNEGALIEALDSGHLSGAAIDVFENEDEYEAGASLRDNLLWAREDIILTPHTASSGGPVYSPMRELIFENIRRLKIGAPLKNAFQL